MKINRKKLPKKQPVPEPYSAPLDQVVSAAQKWTEERFPDAPGIRENFNYPSTRQEALQAMSLFFENRFELFGDYEDAISTRVRVIFHSVLTPPLNIGLITPQEIIDAALDAAEKNPEIPLNSLEGFIRQIIGWREFMRIIYLHHGVMERKENFWNFTREMPPAFYDGTTGIEPIDHTIQTLLEDGYTHHIERLMVLGNFMLLCRIHPPLFTNGSWSSSSMPTIGSWFQMFTGCHNSQTAVSFQPNPISPAPTTSERCLTSPREIGVGHGMVSTGPSSQTTANFSPLSIAYL